MIAIVNYGLSNVASVENMLKRITRELIVTTNDPDQIGMADKLILPGVGSFDRGIANLHDLGLSDAITYAVKVKGTPILGICLGMQILSLSSEEGRLPGLGLIDARFSRFTDSKIFKIPRMGWGWVSFKTTSALTKYGNGMSRFYFVHSYFCAECDPLQVAATCSYGMEYVCAFQRGNIYGVQFHPEKSHRYGQALLKGFIDL